MLSDDGMESEEGYMLSLMMGWKVRRATCSLMMGWKVRRATLSLMMGWKGISYFSMYYYM